MSDDIFGKDRRLVTDVKLGVAVGLLSKTDVRLREYCPFLLHPFIGFIASLGVELKYQRRSFAPQTIREATL